MVIDWIKCKRHDMPLDITLSEIISEEIIAVDGRCEIGCEYFLWIHPKEDLINSENGETGEVIIKGEI